MQMNVLRMKKQQNTQLISNYTSDNGNTQIYLTKSVFTGAFENFFIATNEHVAGQFKIIMYTTKFRNVAELVYLFFFHYFILRLPAAVTEIDVVFNVCGVV